MTDTTTSPGAHHEGRNLLTSVPPSPEVLDETAQVTTASGWVALGAAGALVVAGVLWSFLGTLPQQTSGTAVISQQGATYDIIAGGAGAAVVTVGQGAVVGAGQPVARITPFSADGRPEAPVRAVTTPVAGRVHEILATDGRGVDPADVLVTIDTAHHGPPQAVTYLAAADAARYRPGATVTVTTENLAAGSERTLPATVRSVAEVPSDLGAMTVAVGSDELARRMLHDAGGAAYRVQLSLREPGAPGLDQPADGMVVTITNTYDEIRPIDLLLGRSG